jgi:lambda repressor-like predicted transcriptional regulator
MARRANTKVNPDQSAVETVAAQITPANLAHIDPAIIAAIQAAMAAKATATVTPPVETLPAPVTPPIDVEPFDLHRCVVGVHTDGQPLLFSTRSLVANLFDAGAHMVALSSDKGSVSRDLMLVVDKAWNHRENVDDITKAIEQVCADVCEKGRSLGALSCASHIDGLGVKDGAWRIDVGKGSHKAAVGKAANTLNSYLSAIRAALNKGLRPRMQVEVEVLNPKTGAKVAKQINPFGTIPDLRKASSTVDQAESRAKAKLEAETPAAKREMAARLLAERIVGALVKAQSEADVARIMTSLAQLANGAEALLIGKN